MRSRRASVIYQASLHRMPTVPTNLSPEDRSAGETHVTEPAHHNATTAADGLRCRVDANSVARISRKISAVGARKIRTTDANAATQHAVF